MSDEMKSRIRLPVAGLVAMSLVYVLYAWDRLVIPVELVEVRRVFDLPMTAAGLLASVFTIGIAVTAIPAGFFILRFGTRLSLVLGAVIFSACILYVPFGNGLGDLTAAQVLSGIGEGLYNVAVFSFLGGLSEKYRGTLTGIAASLFGIGIFSGPLVVARIMPMTGNWETAFFVFSIAGFVGAAGIAYTLRKHDIQSNKSTGPITLERLKGVLSPRNLAVAVVMAIDGLGMYSFIAMYETYLRTAHQMSLAEASAIFSLFGIGNIVGGAPAGYLADRIGRRLYLLIALIAAAVVGVAAFMVPPTPWLESLLCFGFGLCANSIYTNCYALVEDQIEKDDIPLGTGVLGTIYFLMGGVSGYALTSARDAFGWHGASIVTYGVPYVVGAVIMAGLSLSSRSSGQPLVPHKAS